MAGTIISTPAVGSADWSGWITQQGATDTGFMRISLTNFSASAASSIATGSVLECAGSIYSFTETAISLATGTASVSVAIYFNVIPSAGGTTVTVVRNSTAPVWVDAKQGFYASVASVSRVIGGEYIGTAATYYSKYLYTGENLIYCLQTNETRPILKKRIAIGEWNMDADSVVDILHGLGDFKKIRGLTGIIRDDGNTNYYNIPTLFDTTNGEQEVGFGVIQSRDIRIARLNGGIFDGASFNATSETVANRGFVFIEYEA